MEQTEQNWGINIEAYNPKAKVVQPKYAHNEAGFHVYASKDIAIGAMAMIKKITGKLLQGYSLTEIVLPSNQLCPCTLAEISFEELKVVCAWITEAAKIEDPLERIKYITCGFIAGLQTIPKLINGMPNVPNSVGATLQATGPGGEKYYFEQIGPGLSDSRVLVVGPEDSYKLHFANKTTISIRGINPSTLKGKKERPIFIEFKDGTKYRIQVPNFEVDRGMKIKKLMRFMGEFLIQDRTNAIVASTKIIPPPEKGMFGGFFSKAPPPLTEKEINVFEISIMKKGKQVAKGSGNYTSFLQFDGKVYWRNADAYPTLKISPKVIPSDHDGVEIKKLIVEKKWEEANKALDEFEADKKVDQKLRKR